MNIEILSLVAQFGFPALICVIIMFYCSKLLEKDKEETKAFTDAINNNTIALTELKMLVNQLYLKVEKIEGGKENGRKTT